MSKPANTTSNPYKLSFNSVQQLFEVSQQPANNSRNEDYRYRIRNDPRPNFNGIPREL